MRETRGRTSSNRLAASWAAHRVLAPMIPGAKRYRGFPSAGAWRALIACAVLTLLAGCGATLLYPRLDTLVAFYLQDLVSLDDAQSEQLSRTLSRHLEWHRSS